MPIEATESRVVLTHPTNPHTRVEILNYGATIVSWRLDGQEQLWLSDAAKLDGSKPVRGGVPLVFPVFGAGKPNHATEKLPQHGFARSSEWEFLGQVSENPPTVQFGLGPENVDAEKLLLWEGANDFTLLLTVTLEESQLTTRIEVENTGAAAFDFQWLFHTYLRIPEISKISVDNLQGQTFFNQLQKANTTETAAQVTFAQETDSIYKKVDTSVDLQVSSAGKPLHVVKRNNLPDAVVWNPWIEKSGGMADFMPKDGYKQMVCIEPGHVSDFVNLSAGESWTAAQTLVAFKQ
ncbi:hypothetical protein BABINDRAFT_40516 [Babjeviella inositovora NRRL Y-12698]|uniref:Glucose-6-phosphate 1-epimerase n=1 Tax=Babjeviella inositovora NRRL Y-12698 TaxID=984486 RepID=A0A1E3QM04_9ASCO|nr:uncharacterized protein BABINDRAFT_40516 [Babjeviella inositovora NRRL Y-12698]ODQ78112.1 hypothetical protein BABINDRAFT_40516 [Babjeviella inositovora NRRL Y-12698]